MPANVPAEFPGSDEELAENDVVVFSDVDYNSMIFYPGLTPPYEYPLGPDRCQMVADFVARGGGFLMTGGCLSFAGFNGIARWHGTVIEEVLPDTISPHDDRLEVVAGFRFAVIDREHPMTAGLDWDRAAFTLCGYNRRAMKPVGHLVARYRDDPMLVTGQYGQGRTAAFMSDFAPHWPGNFPRWAGYGQFWGQMLEWLARCRVGSFGRGRVQRPRRQALATADLMRTT